MNEDETNISITVSQHLPATINWNNHNTWLCTVQAPRAAVAAGGGGAGMSQLPAHINQTWTNQLLDGVQVIAGQVITTHANIDNA